MGHDHIHLRESYPAAIVLEFPGSCRGGTGCISRRKFEGAKWCIVDGPPPENVEMVAKFSLSSALPLVMNAGTMRGRVAAINNRLMENFFILEILFTFVFLEKKGKEVRTYGKRR